MARILLLSPYEPPSDGIAKHTSFLVDAWDSVGHCVLVISPGKQRGLEGAECIGTRSKVARILRQVPRRHTWNEILEFEPDVVFVQFAIAAVSVNLWSVRSLCKKFTAARIPVVVGFHEPAREYDLLGFVTHFIYKAIARVTDVPVVFSSAGRQALIENGLFDEVVEVPHGTTGVAKITDDDIKRVRDLYHVQKPWFSPSALRVSIRERTYFLMLPVQSPKVEATMCSSSSPGHPESAAEYFASWDVVMSSVNDDLRIRRKRSMGLTSISSALWPTRTLRRYFLWLMSSPCRTKNYPEWYCEPCSLESLSCCWFESARTAKRSRRRGEVCSCWRCRSASRADDKSVGQ